MSATGRLSTHVLDTARGRPAAGIPVSLRHGETGEELAAAVTNADGRTDAPLLAPGELEAIAYELRFDVTDFLDGEGFLELVPVRFTVREPRRDHHVPLLLTPWSYAVYRGS